MPSESDLAEGAEILIAEAKKAAEAALWSAVSDVVSDTDEARRALIRVSDDLVNVWRMKLAGKDTALEEKWLEKEARLIAARLGLQASAAANRLFITTANVLLTLGAALLSAYLGAPISFPPIGGGVA